MKAIIADDEPHLAEDLRRRLARLWPELEIAAVFHDGIAAQTAMTTVAPDIAFLDIQMPGLSGLEAARAASPNCRIVFVTAYDEHAVAAFEQAAVDYLLKPASEERFARCVERLRQNEAQDYSALFARLSGLLAASAKPEPLRWIRAQLGQTVRLLPVEEVCYFQSTDKYTAVFTPDAELLLRTPLKELVEQLDGREFWQVHRGTVVSVRRIAAAEHDALGRLKLVLRDRPETLPVSRTYAHLFRQM
ncbi:MAG TPA: LytTR family DNA-binding domain-containing protein [Gallionella sp.]|nr:LytTR family DNA-binding domain-containing protein [Gallionella sp.]